MGQGPAEGQRLASTAAPLGTPGRWEPTCLAVPRAGCFPARNFTGLSASPQTHADLSIASGALKSGALGTKWSRRRCSSAEGVS